MIMLRHLTPPHLSISGNRDEFNVAHKTERFSEFYDSSSKARIKDQTKHLDSGSQAGSRVTTLQGKMGLGYSTPSQRCNT